MKKLISTITLASKLASINRTVGYKDGHWENDSEHSYQLALVCWSANNQYTLGLDDELIMKFALVHDLVEVYAGDVDAFSLNEYEVKNKKENEERALGKLRIEFGYFEEMIQMIERYEEKKDLEATLVYLLDKFIVDVNIYNSKGTYYKDRGITIEKWKVWLLDKIKYDQVDSKLKPLVDESIQFIETNFADGFHR